MKNIKPTKRRSAQAGITMVETLMASAILVVVSLGMIGLIVNSIATNNRNKTDSTQTMLAESIIEHVNSTLIGQSSSLLSDCAGTSFTIDTIPGGANLTASGAGIDYLENIASDATKAAYHMDYTVNTPCASTGALQGTYDVRWNVQLVGGSTLPTKTYMLTVGAKLKNHGEGNRFFSLPVTLRAMAGN